MNPRRAILDRSGRPTRYRIAHENIVELISQSCDNVAVARRLGLATSPFQLRGSRADAFFNDADRNAAGGGWALRTACPSGIPMTRASRPTFEEESLVGFLITRHGCTPPAKWLVRRTHGASCR